MVTTFLTDKDAIVRYDEQNLTDEQKAHVRENIGALSNTTTIPTKTSDLTNDSGFITGYTETDPTVPAWAKAAKKPTYTAAEVGALPSTTTVPTKTSQLTNDSGFITSSSIDDLRQKTVDSLWDGQLYDEGNEYEIATGGWTTLAYAGNPYLTAAAPAVTKTTSYIDVSQTTPLRGGSIIVANAIDMTNFSKLIVDLSNITLSGNGTTITISITDTADANLKIIASKAITVSASDRATHEIDVSDLSGELYVSIHLGTAQNGSASCRVYSVKLFKNTDNQVEYALKTDIPTKTSELTNDSGFITLADITTETVPTYVVTEAESVIDRVVAAQGDRTFTFAAITDLHYGNGGNTDGVQHACQALKYIDSRIKLDAVAVLGDYTDGYPASGLANAIGDFRNINSVLNGLRFAPNLRVQGNHDYYADNGPVVRRYIQAYSDNVVWGNKAAGYFYKDFEDFKIRAICLNTTEVDNANISCSTEQYNWFINSLNMSAKNDAADWQILILSHHPLDWYVQDSTYRFGNILWAYKNGTSWSGGNVSCDFAGKNSATIIANIHGHIHNLLTGEIYRNTGATSMGTSGVVRMCTPEACIKRANQYDGVWKETTSYAKVEGTAQETSFVIYCVDLDTNLITAVCYGAGYDRTADYTNGTQVITYSITNNLTNVTSNNAVTEIKAGQPYTATLTPTGASITSVTVSMGGADVTSTVYSDGVINIAAVSGNIVITAVGAAPETYTNMIPLSVTNTGAAYVGTNGEDGYKRGYRLNSSAAETAADAFGVTGFIPVKFGDFVYFKNISFAPGVEDNSGNYIFVYDSTFASIGGTKSTNMESSAYLFRPIETYDNGYLKSVKMADGSKDYAYIRISAKLLDENSIITVNQPIDEPSDDSEIVNLLDTVGYTNNTRLSSSSGSEKTESGHVATGYIDVSGDKMGDVIRTSGINFGHGTYPDQAVYVRYDANKNVVACGYINSVNRIGPYNKSIDASGNLTLKFDAPNSGDNATSFFRLSGMGVGENGIITRNQEIV